MNPSHPVLHATTVALWQGGAWRGVVLRGPSGSGKSDLALRCLAQGWRLVADDRTLVWTCGGQLYARPPATLAGLAEARGIGVVSRPHLPFVEAALIADLVGGPHEIQRMPEPEVEEVAGVVLPRLRLWALEASAPAKLTLACAARKLGAGPQPAYQAPRADEAEQRPTRSRGPLERI